MKTRVRAAGIIVQDNNILLVKHRHRGTGTLWWTPPGGGFENHDDSVIQCVNRECREEAGLETTAGPLLYLREFTQQQKSIRHLELFFLMEKWQGKPSLNYLPEEDREHVLEVTWIDREQLQKVHVLPDELKTRLWYDLNQPIQTHYLGTAHCAFES